MQFQVPQFIETEDKIVGPLSLRQFAYVGAGGVLSAMLFFIGQTWLWIVGSIIIFAFVIALAFVKIEGRPFISILISAFNFYWKPQTYVWQAEHKPAPVLERSLSAEANRSALQDILGKSALGKKQVVAPAAVRAVVSSGSALHKSWESIQTGSTFAEKTSDKQFLEKKMQERYQIFRQISGERKAAKRIDYR
jgi:PrgI family protein